MARTRSRPRGRRPPRSSLVLRWAAVGALLLVALLYYRPLQAWHERRAWVAEREAQVRALHAHQERLERRLRYVKSDAAVAREARRLGYVKPGERLFIVKGIPEWRARAKGADTIARDGGR